MKHHALIFIAIIALCSSSLAAVDERKFLGSWELEIGIDSHAIITFLADHSYAESLRGFTKASSTGNWRVDGDRLITTIKTNTANKNRVGHEDAFTIVALGDGALVTKDSNGEVYSYKRIDTANGETNDEDKESVTTPDSSLDDSNIPSVAMGKEFKVGDFSYKITRAIAVRGFTRAYQKPLRAAEGAAFMIIEYTVRNDGPESEDVWNSGFTIQDEDGRQFETSSEVETAMEMSSSNPREDFFVKQLQPGVARRLKAGFEVPKAILDQHLVLIIPERGLFSSGQQRVELFITKWTKKEAAKSKKQH